jgi:uncharacterized membrane protein YfcA
VGSGHEPRYAVGSVNTAEFFVTVSAATTFFTEIGAVPLEQLIPVVLGGVLAAPCHMSLSIAWKFGRNRDLTLDISSQRQKTAVFTGV